MEKEQATYIANLFEKYDQPSFEIMKLGTVNDTLVKFHQWTNRKKVIAAYEITRRSTETGYYFILIDWHRNGNYYLVIYAQNKSTTVAELQTIEKIDGSPHFVWKYIPLKRDGKNGQRKAFFKQMFGSDTVQIKLPSSPFEVEGLLEQLFRLCHNRLKADRIVDVFDFEKQ